MKKEKVPANAIFYGNYKDMIYNATPEEVKEIMVAFCEYAFDNKVPKVSPNISLAWGIIKGNIDDDRKQYIERCNKNRENALKRYNKAAEDEIASTTYTLDGHQYELIYPSENKHNIITEEAFLGLFNEMEDEPEKRCVYLGRFVQRGNNGQWENPFEDYEEEIWSEIYQEP